jgi:hypothetical protein
LLVAGLEKMTRNSMSWRKLMNAQEKTTRVSEDQELNVLEKTDGCTGENHQKI